jgi:hypothetical protein
MVRKSLTRITPSKHKCSYQACGYSTTIPSNLTRHVKNVHLNQKQKWRRILGTVDKEGEKTIQCNHCQQFSCSTWSKLFQHYVALYKINPLAFQPSLLEAVKHVADQDSKDKMNAKKKSKTAPLLEEDATHDSFSINIQSHTSNNSEDTDVEGPTTASKKHTTPVTFKSRHQYYTLVT